jgi:uncharacterized protein DUF5999
MCQHQPPCPPADASDREAAHVATSHPGQGWSLLCNDVVMFEDTGALLPDGRCIPPHRPPWIGGHRHASLDPRPPPAKIGAALRERFARNYEEGSLITPGQSARSLMQHLATDATGETWNVNTSRPEE